MWKRILGLVALNLLLWFPSLDNGFSFDDYNRLERAKFAPSAAALNFHAEPGQIINAVPLSKTSVSGG